MIAMAGSRIIMVLGRKQSPAPGWSVAVTIVDRISLG
jgi:hypothetical protein